MSTTLGTISIDLVAGTASFASDMGKARELAGRTAAEIKRSFETIAAATAAAAATVAGGFAAMVSESIEVMANLHKLSEATGASVEGLSRISYAAKLTNTPMEDAGRGLERLAKSAYAAQTGNHALAAVYQQLGVHVTDGNGHLRDSGDILQDVAGKLERYRDDAGKTAILMQLFGRSGAQMNPMLHEMAQHQAELNKEMAAFGLTISGKTASDAEEFHQNMMRLKAAGEGLGIAITASMLPGLKQLAQQLANWAQQSNLAAKVQAFGPEVVKGLHEAGEAMGFLVDHAHGLKIALEGLAGLEVLRIFSPMALGLASASHPMDVLGRGIKMLVESSLGIKGLAKEFDTLAGSIAYEAKFTAMLAKEEGLASAASYGLKGALTSVAGTAGILGAVLAGVGVIIYKDKAALTALAGTDVSWLDYWSGNVVNARIQTEAYGHALKGVWEVLNHNFAAASQDFLVSKDLLHNLKTQQEYAIEYAQARAAAAAGVKPAPSIADPKGLPGLEPKGIEETTAQKVKEKLALINQETAATNALTAVIGKYGSAQIMANAANEAEKVIVELNNAALKAHQPLLTQNEQNAIRTAEAYKGAAEAIRVFSQAIETSSHSSMMKADADLKMSVAAGLGGAAMREQAAGNEIAAITFGQTTLQILAQTDALNKLHDEMLLASQTTLIRANSERGYEIGIQIEQQNLLSAAIGKGEAAMLSARNAAELLAIAIKRDDAETDALRASYQQLYDDTRKLQDAKWAEENAEWIKSLIPPMEEYNAKISTLNEKLAILSGIQGGLSSSQLLEAQLEKHKDLLEAYQKESQQLLDQGTILGGLQSFWIQYTELGKNAARQISDAMNELFTGIEDNLAKLIVTGKANWQKMFEGLATNLTKDFLHDAMGGLMKGAGNLIPGLGGLLNPNAKPGDMPGKPLFVQIVGSIPGLDGSGSGDLGGIAKALFGGGTPAGIGGNFGIDASAGGGSVAPVMSGIAGFLGKLGGFFAHLFGGGFAGGGMLDSSKLSVVGENGPELVGGSRVFSNSQSRRMLSGGAGDVYIDARGASATEVQMRVNRGMAISGHGAAQTAVMSTQEIMRRRPRGSFTH
jgi:hypothetical protein